MRDAATTLASPRDCDLMLDRAIPGGGWNYGNNVVFGHVLRPHPGPTGIALMALAAAGAGDCPAVAPAIDYLRRTLPTIRAAASLGWGVLGLKAHGVCPPDADTWLAEAYGHCTGRAGCDRWPGHPPALGRPRNGS